jgi:hypothetical protein
MIEKFYHRTLNSLGWMARREEEVHHDLL